VEKRGKQPQPVFFLPYKTEGIKFTRNSEISRSASMPCGLCFDMGKGRGAQPAG
jgi:hypothetical protein